jgi:hypothetical protein
MEYSTDILSLLQSLELQRVAGLKKFALIALFALFVLFINILFFIKFRSNFVPSLLFGFIILVGSYYILNTKYKTNIQNILIPKLISKIDPDARYEKENSVDIDSLNGLKFFSHKIEKADSSGKVFLKEAGKNVSFSFVTLESMKTDTEEGEHFTKRFDGLIIKLDLGENYTGIHLLGDGEKKAEFEAGDYLNPPHMGLKLVRNFTDYKLYSEDGVSRLNAKVVEKILSLREDIGKDLWAVFDKNSVFIFVDGLDDSFEVSLFQNLKLEDFVGQYVKLLKTLRVLIL